MSFSWRSRAIARRRARGATAKTMLAVFLCLAHNLLVLLVEGILRVKKVDNKPERERKNERREAALKRGANFVATALQRFTVRNVKFLRWLRTFFHCKTPRQNAIARLRHVYDTYG